ncbi:MAG TPA: MMPL family transporter [Chloroflexota bacterium]
MFFGTLARTMYRRRWLVLGVWLAVLIVAGAFAAQVGSVLGPGDFVNKGSDSYKAAALLDTKFHQNDQKVSLIIFHNPAATTADSTFRSAVNAAAARIRADAPLRVSYLDNPIVSGNRQLISRDHHSVALLVSSSLKPSDIQGQVDHLRQIVRTPGFTTYVTGSPAQNQDNTTSSKNDLAKGDSITVPILVVILLLVFGSVVAMALPLVLAASSILLSLALVYVFGHYLDTSVYVTNMVTVLGLGIGIDYSLFIVYRFREELRRTAGDVEASIVRTMQTTGRAVFFSGLTVAIGISSLILTGVSFMQTMGLGGLLVPLTSLLVAMTLLPAVLSLLGTRVNRFRVVPQRLLSTGGNGMWHRWATFVMHRPWVTGGIALVLLLALAYPVTQLNFAFGSLKNQPKSLESIAGIEFMQANFPSAPNPTQVVIDAGGSLIQPRQLAGLQAFQRTIQRDPEVVRAAGPTDILPVNTAPSATQLKLVTGRYLSADHRTAVISVIPRNDVGTTAAEKLVRRLRDDAKSIVAGPLTGDAIYVGGQQADFTDFNDSLYAKFPLIVVIVLLLTFGFLFVAFRSAVLPLQAVLLNLLSVGAAYGMLELVFQRGIGAGLLNFSPESGVAGWVPIFLFALLFGLSTDYEVFLLSRIRERWLASGDNAESVAFGLEKTGRLISSAAAVMIVAFAGFVIGSQVQLKELGFGMLAAIAIDATVIRLVLVPSLMAIVGRANWWVPSFLRGFASRGTTFSEDAEPVPAVEEQEPALA